MQKALAILLVIFLLITFFQCKLEDDQQKPGTGIVIDLADLPDQLTESRSTNVSIGGKNFDEYKFRLDGGEWSNARSLVQRITLYNLQDGLHTLRVIGKGSDGQWQSESEAKCFSWTIQFHWKVVLSGLPEEKIKSRSVNITVGGRHISAYKYKLDDRYSVDEEYSPERLLSQNIVIDQILEGSHTLSVIGKSDESGEWLALDYGAVYAWRIVLTPPVPSFGNLPFKKTGSQTLDLIINNPEIVAYKYKLDGGEFSQELGTAVHIMASGLISGVHTLTVMAGDNLGNWHTMDKAAVYTWTIEAGYVPPHLLLNAPAQLSNAITVNSSINSAPLKASGLIDSTNQIVGYKYKLNAADWSPEHDIATPITATGLIEGANSLGLICKDAIGNCYEPVSYSWSTDFTPPVVNAGKDIPDWTEDAVILHGQASDLHDCTYLWHKDAGDNTNGNLIFGNVSDLTTTVCGEDNQEGSYRVTLTVTDAAGNAASDSLIFNWDKKGPTVVSGLEDVKTGVPRKITPVLADCNPPINCHWEQIGGTGKVTFSGTSSNGIETTIQGPAGVSGPFTIKLTANDVMGHQSEKTFKFDWDLVAPLGVTGLTGKFNPVSTTLSWTNPTPSSTQDLYGVLILESTTPNFHLTDIPVQGKKYKIGDKIGNAVVEWTLKTTSAEILYLPSQVNLYFAVYTFDDAYNYSVTPVTCSGIIEDYIIFVSKSGSDYKSGLTPANAKQTIQAAINAVSNSGVPGKVYVSAGNYEENIILKDKVSLYGGFKADWSFRNNQDREYTDYKTGILVSNETGITATGISDTVMLDGFVITNAGLSTTGITNTNSALTVSNNTFIINGKDGIFNKSSSPLIQKNIIKMGSGKILTGIRNNNSSPKIFNNFINGGNAQSNAYGIYNENFSQPVVVNNTICGGNAGIAAYGVYMIGSPGITLENNIIFTSGGDFRFGIYEYYLDDPSSCRNNDIFDCLVLYHNGSETASMDIVDIYALNNLTVASGNISVDPCFTNKANMNWRLTNLTGINVRAGGVALSAHINDDIFGLPRTSTYFGEGLVDPSNVGAAGWSIGACELD